MITLHILKALSDAGFGTIDTNLFWEEVPLDGSGNAKEGVWIVTRGAPVTRFSINIQSFDIYARYTNKITGATKLEGILNYLQEAFGKVCDLPTVPPHSTAQYKNVRIIPTSGVENAGTDENGKVVRVISGEVRYNKLNEES